MQGRLSKQNIIWMVIMAVFCLVGMILVNYRYAVQNPGGTDFMIRWLGTRLMIREGLNPYGEEATEQIQQMFYNRVAETSEDQLLFVYPLFSAVIFAPYSFIPDYNLARAIWMTTLQVSIILIMAAGLSLSRWTLKPLMLAVLLTFALLWYYGLRSVINGNIAVIVGLFVALAFLAIRDERNLTAGILLALSTVKPPVVVLLLAFVLLWAFSTRRWVLIWGFVGSLFFLSASMMFFVTNWIWLNLQQVLAYPGYAPPGTPRAVFAEWLPGIGNTLGWILMILLIVLLLWEWAQAWGKDFNHFYWTASLTLVITNLIGIQTATENYMVMLPALILVLASWNKQSKTISRVLFWASLGLLFFGVWWLFFATLQQGGPQPMQGLMMYFPLPVLLLFGLYLTRRDSCGSRGN